MPLINKILLMTYTTTTLATTTEAAILLTASTLQRRCSRSGDQNTVGPKHICVFLCGPELGYKLFYIDPRAVSTHSSRDKSD